MVHRAVLAERYRLDLCVLHADNGAIRKSSTLQVKLEAPGVLSSFSRLRVSKDNAYSESLFRTCKYRPDFPERGFASIQAARILVLSFVRWYNNDHRQSALKYVTLAQRHAGLDTEILAKRRSLYETEKLRHPARWSGQTRNWDPVTIVHLNKQKAEETPMIPPSSSVVGLPTIEHSTSAMNG